MNIIPIGPHDDGRVISSAVSLSALAPVGANLLLMQALDQNVRYTLDGTKPTASKGFQLAQGDPPIIIPLTAETTVTVIQEAATADLQFQFATIGALI